MSLRTKLYGHRLSLRSFLTNDGRFFSASSVDPNRNPNHSPIVIPDEPTSAYYDELIFVAGRHKDFDTLRNLLNKRVKDGCFNTINTFGFLTGVESSFSAFDDLLETLARLDKGLTRKNACDMLIARLCKLKKIDHALRVVDLMALGNFGLNAVSYHHILNSLTRAKDIDRAWSVVKSMRENNVSPDLMAYNHFLTAYAVTGDLLAMAGVLEEMEREGLGSDSRTYDALVLGACRAGKLESALAVLERMAREGVPPNYSTHVCVVKTMLRMGYRAQAVEFVKIVGGKDKGLDTENFGVLADNLIKMNQFDLAKLVLQEMEERGLQMGHKLRDFYNLNCCS